jgi:hypothetical protein
MEFRIYVGEKGENVCSKLSFSKELTIFAMTIGKSI